MSVAGQVAEHPAPPLWGIARTLWHRLAKYWPEIAAFVAMMAYTAVRTFFVAHGVDSVARTDWRIFLLIEVVFTVPYVWGIGDLVRGAMLGTHSRRREALGVAAVMAGVVAPYAYIAAFGGLLHVQSAIITAAMVVLALVGLLRSLKKLSDTRAERSQRERAQEGRLTETQRLRELERSRAMSAGSIEEGSR